VNFLVIFDGIQKIHKFVKFQPNFGLKQYFLGYAHEKLTRIEVLSAAGKFFVNFLGKNTRIVQKSSNSATIGQYNS